MEETAAYLASSESLVQGIVPDIQMAGDVRVIAPTSQISDPQNIRRIDIAAFTASGKAEQQSQSHQFANLTSDPTIDLMNSVRRPLPSRLVIVVGSNQIFFHCCWL